MKYTTDLLFSLVILCFIIYGYIFAGTITTGEFSIALIVAYVGARYLFFTDFICEILETRIEAATAIIEDDNE